MKELIIDKNTKLSKIEDKESFTKLILKTKVNPKSLKGFKNIKVLEIDRYKPLYIKGYNVYNEKNINNIPFKENIEKLTFSYIEHYGKDQSSNNYYSLYLSNLKSVEFIGEIRHLYDHYLYYCKNLENIIYDSDKIVGYIELFLACPLKTISVLKKNKKYDINIKYKLTGCILKNSQDYFIEYGNTNISSRIKIEDESVKEIHILCTINNDLISDNVIFIPDYITHLNIYDKFNIKDYDSVSFNLNLLKTQIEKTNLIGKYDINKLKKIIIRSNNNMSLFENTEIFIENDLKELYIENKKLHIVYPDKVILVDRNGKKIIKEYVVKVNNKEAIDELFNKYNLDEIKEYLYYKELLELLKKYNDEELDNAMELVGERIIKKLTK